MQKFELVEITTADKLIHQGMFFMPSRPTKRALLWVHGLTSTFYGNVRLQSAFTAHCETFGYGYASFNTRGHDLVAGIRKVDKRKAKGYSSVSGGGGAEDFKKAVLDIAAGIQFLKSQGFSEIIIIGHSTGANKACYFAATKKTPNLFAVVLASPVSDRYDPELDPQILKKNLEQMHSLVKAGKGDELQLGYHFFPITPKRYVSLFTKDSLEDQFDYGESKPKLKHFSAIKKPLLVVLGSADEYLDRPAEDAMRVYDAHTTSKNYLSVILPNVLHSYNGAEENFVETVTAWVHSL